MKNSKPPYANPVPREEYEPVGWYEEEPEPTRAVTVWKCIFMGLSIFFFLLSIPFIGSLVFAGTFAGFVIFCLGWILCTFFETL